MISNKGQHPQKGESNFELNELKPKIKTLHLFGIISPCSESSDRFWKNVEKGKRNLWDLFCLSKIKLAYRQEDENI